MDRNSAAAPRSSTGKSAGSGSPAPGRAATPAIRFLHRAVCNAVYDAAQYVDGTDPNYTFVVYKPGEARDLPVMLRGNVATPGEITPRHFLSVLSKSEPDVQERIGPAGAGEKIFTDAAPLTARVIVNRVWGWHFGKPLVGTPSDFGTQGEKPTHPGVAGRFGGSLHREWLVAQVAASRDHALGDIPAIEPAREPMPNKRINRTRCCGA